MPENEDHRWLEALQSANRKFTVSLMNGAHQTVIFKAKPTADINRVPHPHASLAGLPESWTAVFNAGDTPIVQVNEANPSHTIRQGGTPRKNQKNQSVLVLGKTFRGSVVIDITFTEIPHVVQFTQVASRLDVIDGNVDLQDSKAEVIAVHGGQIHGGETEILTLLGGTVENPLIVEKTTTESTRVEGKAVLDCSVSGLNLSDIAGVGNAAELCLASSKERNGATIAADLRAGHVTDLAISSSGDHIASMKIASGSRISVTGLVHLQVAAGGLVVKIRFDPDHPRRERSTHLQAGRGSTLLDVSGHVELGQVAGATIVGTTKGFHIIDIASPRMRAGQRSDPTKLCQEATLRGFTVDREADGLSALNLMASASTLSPHVAGLPGSDSTLWRAVTDTLRKAMTRLLGIMSRVLGLAKKTTTSPHEGDVQKDSVSLQWQAALMLRMRQLTREKGASGAVRTRVGWCAQRLRHETTTGFWEKSALWGYRAMGYGERPAPALLTWLVVAGVVAGVVVGADKSWSFGGDFWDFSPTGFWRPYLTAFFDFASGPVGSLSGTGSTALSESWQYLVRAIVAVPLVVGALSLRNYVRSGT